MRGWHQIYDKNIRHRQKIPMMKTLSKYIDEKSILMQHH